MNRLNRRDALRNLAAFLAASPLLTAQDDLRLPASDELVNVFEMESIAHSRVSRTVYDQISGGAGAEVTLRRNREAFDRMTFRPRMLIDVREMNLRTKLFGQEMEWPVLIAPASGQQLIHVEGDAATLRGAESTRTSTVISSRPSGTIDQLAAKAKVPLWFQVDPESDTEHLREQVHQAAAAGCKAICLSLGVSYEALRERDLRNGLMPHPVRLSPRSAMNPSWTIVQQLRECSHLPIVVKGIMRSEDARTAIESGAQGIVVSNYGGRYSDGSSATMEVLPSIADAVRGQVPVLIDGGFRRGTDILKALALGANGVMLGRPILWGLAAYGAEGVQKILELLQTELALAMGLSGTPNIPAITRNLVKVHRI